MEIKLVNINLMLIFKEIFADLCYISMGSVTVISPSLIRLIHYHEDIFLFFK